jgi:uncharacterized protein YraI
VRLRLAAVACATLVFSTLASAQAVVVNRNVNVRAGPDRVFPVVGWLPAGARVRVLGCTGGWRWCEIGSGRNRGWVNASFLSSVPRRTIPVVPMPPPWVGPPPPRW